MFSQQKISQFTFFHESASELTLICMVALVEAHVVSNFQGSGLLGDKLTLYECKWFLAKRLKIDPYASRILP